MCNLLEKQIIVWSTYKLKEQKVYTIDNIGYN